MTEEIFKNKFTIHRANELQDFIKRNNLEEIFQLKELRLKFCSCYKYSFYFREKLINSFEIQLKNLELDQLSMWEYCIGFMDCYLLLKS